MKVMLVLSGAALLFVCRATTLLAQGSLTPPSGPPAPTMKTLDQVEARTPIGSLPFTISNSGSYYLTRNLSALPDQGGIVINASDVTLDLNGFTLFGTLGAEGSHGVTVAGAIGNVTVKNGSLNNWKGRGISTGASIPNCRFFDLRIRDAGAEGLVGGVGAMVERCTVFSSVAAGIVVGDKSSVKDCISSANRDDGIQTGARSVVMRCLADGNLGDGITVAAASRVIGNHCTNNDYGISPGGPSGIVDGNTCYANRIGINLVSRTLVIRNVAGENTQGNFQFSANPGIGRFGEIIPPSDDVYTETVGPWANFSQ